MKGAIMKKDRNILVVDNEVLVTESLQTHLHKNGYSVYVAHNGNETLRLFRKLNMSLVILDLMLPDINGEEICKIIRSAGRTPIIILAAEGQETDMLEGLRIGADDYLVKPFSPKIVGAKVEAILSRAECESNLHIK